MTSGRPRALVADDDLEMQRVVAEAIEQLGVDVSRASSGAELIEQLAEASFDVVVTDVAMPWMTGLQAMHAARTAGLTTPTVVMTGLDDPRIVDQAASLDTAIAFLKKPFSLGELETAVRVVLDDRLAALR
jgi:two-component system OmpR family response regulator